MGRDTGLLPRPTGRRETSLASALLVVAGLALASLGTTRGAWGVPLLVVGVGSAGIAGVRVLSRATAGCPRRTVVLLAFAGLVTAFFGGDGLIPLAVVEGLGRGVVASAVGVGAGLVAWSLTGLRPARGDRRPDPGTTGTALVCAGLVAEAVAQTGWLPPDPALALAVTAWAVTGFGMGLAYGRLSAQVFDDLPSGQVAAVAGAVAFAETAAVVVGSLLGAGVYSLATGLGTSAAPGIGSGFLLVAAVGLAATVVAARR